MEKDEQREWKVSGGDKRDIKPEGRPKPLCKDYVQ